jgi:hypothetical protein
MFYDRLLPGGYLLLGHSESLLNVSTAFELVHLREDLVYRKPLTASRFWSSGDFFHRQTAFADPAARGAPLGAPRELVAPFVPIAIRPGVGPERPEPPGPREPASLPRLDGTSNGPNPLAPASPGHDGAASGPKPLAPASPYGAREASPTGGPKAPRGGAA